MPATSDPFCTGDVVKARDKAARSIVTDGVPDQVVIDVAALIELEDAGCDK